MRLMYRRRPAAWDMSMSADNIASGDGQLQLQLSTFMLVTGKRCRAYPPGTGLYESRKLSYNRGGEEKGRWMNPRSRP